MSLQGKCAVVTGGSRGIGRAVCLELARQGANILLCYAASKAGVIGLTKSAAKELAPGASPSTQWPPASSRPT